MSKDIIIYPSGDTTNSNPFIRFSGGSDMNYIMEMTSDGYIDLSIEENIVTSGLTFYVDAGNYESYSGGTTWYDLEGANNGTLINGPIYNNGSIIFDGVDDYVNFGSFQNTYISDPSLNGNIISFSVWCYAIGGWYILSSGAQTSGARGIALSYQNGNGFLSFCGTKVASINISAGFPTNEWINWTGVADGNYLTVYKNGTFYNSTLMGTTTRTDNHHELTMGVPNNAKTSYQFEGYVGSTLIYNRALSATEVLQNYNAQKHRFGL